MIRIEQTPDGVDVQLAGNFPDLVCDLVVAYKIVEMRGAALDISVPRLLDLVGNTQYVADISEEYRQRYGLD